MGGREQGRSGIELMDVVLQRPARTDQYGRAKALR
jgi:hypothetical protein